MQRKTTSIAFLCTTTLSILFTISPPTANAAITFYPGEAQALATDITGNPIPPDDIVAEIQLNLDAVRTLYPQMNNITIFPRGGWWVGDGDDIRISGDSYVFMRKWGDCPAGCIYQENYYFNTNKGSIKLTGGLTPFSADINGDGEVSLIELDILGENWNTPLHATAFQGDLNGDAKVGLLDLDILGREMQPHTQSPTPTTFTLLTLGSLLLIKRKS